MEIMIMGLYLKKLTKTTDSSNINRMQTLVVEQNDMYFCNVLITTFPRTNMINLEIRLIFNALQKISCNVCSENFSLCGTFSLFYH